MAYKETANFSTRGDGSNFLVDLSQVALPALGAAAGAFAGNPMLGYQVGNMGASMIAKNNQVSGGAQMANGLMGIGSSFLGGMNESVKANGGNIPQVMLYNGGGTHEQNPIGGIPVDAMGNPSMQASALVEANEVGYKLPNDKSGYVFSDRIKYPGKKVTYSDEAKRILGKYKNRLGKDLDKPDTLAKKSLDSEIEELKNSQEAIKQDSDAGDVIKSLGSYIDSYAKGGAIHIDPSKRGTFKAQATKMNMGVQEAASHILANKEKYSPSMVKKATFAHNFAKEMGGELNILDNGGDAANYLKGAGYKEALTGYGMQAATRLPQLFTRPESISYDRISPELIDLAQERANMQTSRNAQLGFLKRQASMAGSAGQALNYLGSAVPAAYNQYDQGYNQSIERESNANAQILNQANAQNAQIQMKEAEANAMERDAARSIRDKAIADIGDISAQGYGLKSKLMQGYYGLQAQAAMGDYGIRFDKNGQFIQERRRGATDIGQSLPSVNKATIETLLQNYNAQNKPVEQFVTPELELGVELGGNNPLIDYAPNYLLKSEACGGKLCKGGYIKKKGKK